MPKTADRKTRKHTRDLDQIHADLRSKRHLEQHLESKAPEDLPALGLFYCVECAKHFESDLNYTKHTKGKPHKRRVRQMQEEPYSQKEAEAATGLTTDNGKRGGVEVEMIAADEDIR